MRCHLTNASLVFSHDLPSSTVPWYCLIGPASSAFHSSTWELRMLWQRSSKVKLLLRLNPLAQSHRLLSLCPPPLPLVLGDPPARTRPCRACWWRLHKRESSQRPAASALHKISNRYTVALFSSDPNNCFAPSCTSLLIVTANCLDVNTIVNPLSQRSPLHLKSVQLSLPSKLNSLFLAIAYPTLCPLACRWRYIESRPLGFSPMQRFTVGANRIASVQRHRDQELIAWCLFTPGYLT
jgi:hypothetical protein